MKISAEKMHHLKNLSSPDGVIAALAIDQRGSFEKMLPTLEGEKRSQTISDYKSLVAEILTPYASSILLDPIYGLAAAPKRDANAGLLLAYEITGYENADRQLRLIDGWSAQRIKDAGADAAKILLYYDVDDAPENNDKKKAMVEKIGKECDAIDLPLFLEIITYDNKIGDTKSKEFAKVKPHKVNEAVRIFSDPRYLVDVLKLEVPVNMNFVEGYGDEVVMTKEEAKQAFLAQSQTTGLPYIFLSAGVPMSLFVDTLYFAKEAGAKFNGVLCGRATWRGGVDAFVASPEDGRAWLETVGRKNIEDLNRVITDTCSPWTDKLDVE